MRLELYEAHVRRPISRREATVAVIGAGIAGCTPCSERWLIMGLMSHSSRNREASEDAVRVVGYGERHRRSVVHPTRSLPILVGIGSCDHGIRTELSSLGEAIWGNGMEWTFVRYRACDLDGWAWEA
jgi:hypothetical protein